MRISDWSSDVCSSDLIDLLAPEQVAELASELDTDDAVAIIEDMEEDEQQAVLQAMEPEDRAAIEDALSFRSEEHTSELQSLMRISYAVFCLKKKKTTTNKHSTSPNKTKTPKTEQYTITRLTHREQ